MLEYVHGTITGAQYTAAQARKFFVNLMRQMDRQRMNLFVIRATMLALDYVDESLEEKKRLSGQQTAAPVFVVPIPQLDHQKNWRWLPIISCWFSRGATTNSAEFKARHQDMRHQRISLQLCHHIPTCSHLMSIQFSYLNHWTAVPPFQPTLDLTFSVQLLF